jgi:hypothetical protein
MANTTIRQLPEASPLSANDFLLIAQEDGTTKKVPLSRMATEGNLVTDASGQSVTTTRVKIAVGIDSSLKGLDGVVRSASNSWTDKAWMPCSPQSGQDEESIRQTDFCYFCAVNQPTPVFMVNRPFVSLDEAMVWAYYNVPPGWDLQFEFWGDTTCFHGADSLAQFGNSITSKMNYGTLCFVAKMRYIGVYNSTTKYFDVNPILGVRWICDYEGYQGEAIYTKAYDNLGDGAEMHLNSQQVVRSPYGQQRAMMRSEDTWNYGASTYGAAANPSFQFAGKVEATPRDINIHVGGAGSALRFWFRHIQNIYIVGCNWCDYAFGHGNVTNQRFFRFSKAIVHILGEPNHNYGAGKWIIANQRGVSFYSKQFSSTLFELTEGAKVNVMTNIRHYAVGATESWYRSVVAQMPSWVAKGMNTQEAAHNPTFTSGEVLGAQDYFYWLPASQQALRLARVGIGGSGANQGCHFIFDPIGSGWRIYRGMLCADNGDLKYPGTNHKMISYAKTSLFSATNFLDGPPDEQHFLAADPNVTSGLEDLPLIDWGETHGPDDQPLPGGGPLGWLMGDDVSVSDYAGDGSLPVPRKYHPWNSSASPFYTSSYEHFYGKVVPETNSVIWDPSKGRPYAPAVVWHTAIVNDSSNYSQFTPGVFTGPNYGNNGNNVYDQRGYRHFGLSYQDNFNNDDPSNDNPGHPDNRQYHNSAGGTGFYQMFFTGINARQGGAPLFTPDSAFYYSSDSAKIFLRQDYNTLNMTGWIWWLFGDFSGIANFANHCPTQTGSHHSWSFYYPTIQPAMAGYDLSGNWVASGLNNYGNSSPSIGNKVRGGLLRLPNAEPLLDQNLGASAEHHEKDAAWSGYYNANGFIRYKGKVDGCVHNDFFYEDSPIGPIIGGGAKEDFSIYPGTNKAKGAIGRSLAQNKLLIEPLNSAIGWDGNWLYESGWSMEAASSSQVPIGDMIGHDACGVRPMKVMFGLEGYKEMFTTKRAVYTSLDAYGTSPSFRGQFGINGSHPNAGSGNAFGGGEGAGQKSAYGTWSA